MCVRARSCVCVFPNIKHWGYLSEEYCFRSVFCRPGFYNFNLSYNVRVQCEKLETYITCIYISGDSYLYAPWVCLMKHLTFIIFGGHGRHWRVTWYSNWIYDISSLTCLNTRRVSPMKRFFFWDGILDQSVWLL